MKKISVAVFLFCLMTCSMSSFAAMQCSNKQMLFNAIRGGDSSVFEQYRSAKCSLNVTDKRGFSIYDVAALVGNRKIMNSLVENKAVKTGQFSSSLIRLIQTGLRYIDMDAGPIDGKLNNSTRAAIKSFQRKLGQNPSGNISTDWLVHFYKRVAKQVQRDLNNLGYSAGTPDGIIGADTKKAIEQFRRKNAIAGEYDQIDDQLIYQLMLASNNQFKKKIAKNPQVSRNSKNTKTSDKVKNDKQLKAEQERKLAEEKERKEQRRLAAQKEREKELARERAREEAKEQRRLQAERQRIEDEQATIQAEREAAERRKAQNNIAKTLVPTSEPKVSIQSPLRNSAEIATSHSPAAQAIAKNANSFNNVQDDQLDLRDRLNRMTGDKVTTVQGTTTPNSSSSESIVKKNKFTTVSGILSFVNGSCSIQGRKLDSSWCSSNRQEAGKKCDTVISSSGRVLSTRCK